MSSNNKHADQPHPQAKPQYYSQAQFNPAANMEYPNHSHQSQNHNQQQQQQPRAPMNIPIIRETAASSRQGSARASPQPMMVRENSPRPSPRASPRPDFSAAVPQSAQQHQVPRPEPQPDYHAEPQLRQPSPVPPQHRQPSPVPPQHQQQPQHQATPPPQPAAPQSAEEKAYEIINNVVREVKALEDQVNSFQGTKKDKQYKYLEEMMTRSLIKTDSVEAGSNDEVRQARKQTVRMIEAAINLLELKALAAETKTEPPPSGNEAASSTPAESAPTASQNTNNSSQDGQDKSASPVKDPSRVKEMQLDSEIQC